MTGPRRQPSDELLWEFELARARAAEADQRRRDVEFAQRDLDPEPDPDTRFIPETRGELVAVIALSVCALIGIGFFVALLWLVAP